MEQIRWNRGGSLDGLTDVKSVVAIVDSLPGEFAAGVGPTREGVAATLLEGMGKKDSSGPSVITVAYLVLQYKTMPSKDGCRKKIAGFSWLPVIFFSPLPEISNPSMTFLLW